MAIDLRARLEKLVPMHPTVGFIRFNLPDQDQIHTRNRIFQSRLIDEFSKPPRPAFPYSRNELTAKLGNLEAHENPVETMRKLHEDGMLEIAEFFKTNYDPRLASLQLSELRQCLVTWAFRLAAIETPANLALLLGGSAANGVHTFRTDFDFVVIPHAPEDREAARLVQLKMAGLMLAFNLEADWVMPGNFAYSPLEEIEKKYIQLVNPTEIDKQVNGFMFNASASFYRFLMDVRVIGVFSREKGFLEKGMDFAARLGRIQSNLIFSAPAHVIENCRADYASKLILSSQPDEKFVLNIKLNPLRLFHYALYAGRAKLGIRESNFWNVIDKLEIAGLLSGTEAKESRRLLKFFIGMRHLIGLTVKKNIDSTKLQEDGVDVMAKKLGVNKNGLVEMVKRLSAEMVARARLIIEK